MLVTLKGTEEWENLPELTYKSQPLEVKGHSLEFNGVYDKLFINCDGTDMLSIVFDFTKMEFNEVDKDFQVLNSREIYFEDDYLVIDIPRQFLSKYILFEQAVNEWFKNVAVIIEDGGDL